MPNKDRAYENLNKNYFIFLLHVSPKVPLISLQTEEATFRRRSSFTFVHFETLQFSLEQRYT